MSPFACKTPSERNKMIAAVVLGVLALSSLLLAFGPSVFSKKVTVTPVVSSSPKAAASPQARSSDLEVPTGEQVDFDYSTTPVVYDPSSVYAPEAGRNIFAFYEPPPPCRPPQVCPTPTPKPVITPTPTPAPPPPMTATMITPQNLYAGMGNFRLEVTGDKFDPSAHIYFNQSEMPTKFVSPQKLTAEIPSALIAQEGPKQVMVQTPDGKLYSNQLMLNVQAPPKPQLQFIGMVARKRYNNDTAYFLETGKQTPFGARLNDVVGGRFRVISISSKETVLQDTSLGFKYPIPLYQPPAGSSVSPGSGNRTDFSQENTFQPYNNPNMVPAMPQVVMPPGMNLPPGMNQPGIQPGGNQQYMPPQQRPRPQRSPQQDKKKDDDDDDDDGDGN
jgi:hypothetical protein